jgi:tetratricopeptide (TPR) repeat protein
MLLPVAGLVQVGSQGMADRYTYLPSIGLALAAAWSGAELAAARPGLGRVVAAAAAAWLVACLALARAQVFTWRDSVALFEHARAVAGSNVVVEMNLAEAHEDAGDFTRALEHYENALALQPGASGADTRIAALRARRGELDAALRHLAQALRLDPGDAAAHLELGRLQLRAGRAEPAAQALGQALALDAGLAQARYHLAELEALRGDRVHAAQLFAEALSARPPARDEPVLDKHAAVLAALAAGCAEAGRLEAAARWGARSHTLARLARDADLAAQLEGDLARWRTR